MSTNVLTETAPVAAGLDLSASDLEQGRLFLQQTNSYVVGAIVGLSDAQWRYKPAADRWSIAEIVEHVAIVQELVLGPIRAQLAAAPVCDADREYKVVDGIVLNQFSNRLKKFPAPEAAHPNRQFTLEVAFNRLRENYSRLTGYLDSTPGIRRHLRESPPLKAISNGAHDSMDGYQWVLASAAHAERHAKQILELKADPGFPTE